MAMDRLPDETSPQPNEAEQNVGSLATVPSQLRRRARFVAVPVVARIRTSTFIQAFHLILDCLLRASTQGNHRQHCGDAIVMPSIVRPVGDGSGGNAYPRNCVAIPVAPYRYPSAEPPESV